MVALEQVRQSIAEAEYVASDEISGEHEWFCLFCGILAGLVIIALLVIV